MGLLVQGFASETGVIGGFVITVSVFFRFGSDIEKAFCAEKIAGVRTAEKVIGFSNVSSSME